MPKSSDPSSLRLNRRLFLAGGLSVCAHLTLLFWGFWSFNLGLDIDPKIEIEFQTIEMLDPDALQQSSPEPEPPPPPQGPVLPPPGTPLEGEKDAPKEEPEEKKPKPKFGAKGSQVDRLAPANSTFSMLLATKRIAKLPYANDAAEIMAPLPDFQLIIQGGGFDVWRDFDYIVIASPDIRDVTQSFLAVQYKLSREEIVAGLERSAKAKNMELKWEEKHGLQMANPRPADPNKRDYDPRWFVFLNDEPVAVYVREEFLSQIQSGPDQSKGKTSGNFVANITRMRRFARREPKAGMQLRFRELRQALAKAKAPFPFPNNLEVMAEAAKRPRVAIKLEFLSEEEAKQAESFWTKDLKKLIQSDFKIRFLVESDYNSTEVEQIDKQLILRNRFSTERIQFVLGMIADMGRKFLKKDKDEMARMRAEREALMKQRLENKWTPSEAFEAANSNKAGDNIQDVEKNAPKNTESNREIENAQLPEKPANSPTPTPDESNLPGIKESNLEQSN